MPNMNYDIGYEICKTVDPWNSWNMLKVRGSHSYNKSLLYVFSWQKKKTHCGLVTPDCDRYLGQHWLRWWLDAWRHQAITGTNVDWSHVKSYDIHIRAISQQMPQTSISKIYLKITCLKFHSNIPGANELTLFGSIQICLGELTDRDIWHKWKMVKQFICWLGTHISMHDENIPKIYSICCGILFFIRIWLLIYPGNAFVVIKSSICLSLVVSGQVGGSFFKSFHLINTNIFKIK